MSCKGRIRRLAAALLLLGFQPGSCIEVGGRVVVDLNTDWRFKMTTDDAPATGDCNMDDCQPWTNDRSWRSLDVPHDFVVEGVFDRTAGDALHGYLPGGKAWYRRTFRLPSEWSGKKHVLLDFEGVQRNSTTFLNGKLVGRHASGYTSFHYRLDGLKEEALRFGDEDNVVAVHVDATQWDGWWYDGGGIYRNVRLVASELLHIVPWGVYAPSKVVGDIQPSPVYGLVAPAAMKVQVTVENSASSGTATFSVTATCTGADGHTISSGGGGVKGSLGPGQTGAFEVMLDIKDAALWSLDHPNLYTVVATVMATGTTGQTTTVDEMSVTTGIRTVEFSAYEGLLLNGERVKVKGMCNHQDFAGVGVAVPDDLQGYRVTRMQDMGVNAWRTAHNPPSPALLDWTDRLGMLVWDENHRNRAEGEWFTDLQSLVLRDRNHPSIIIWSLCNEVLCEGWNQTSAAILKAEIKRLDPNGQRYVSAAMNDAYDSGFNLLLDLMGFNYHVSNYMSYHAAHPDQPVIGSETSSAYTDRGVYERDEVNAHLDAYDKNAPPWGNTAQDAWCPIGGRAWFSGGFIWTGFDYRGEPTPFVWPSIGSHYGNVDVAGFEKDNYYYYQSVWRSEPMGRCTLLRGDKKKKHVMVWAYSNQKEVELLLNGRSLGRQAMPKEADTGYSCRHLEWQVEYEPGTLEARAYASADPASSYVTDVVTTTGPASELALSMDWPRLPFSSSSSSSAMVLDTATQSVVILLTVSVTGGGGVIVPTAAVNVTMTLEGPARFLGVGNGDPSCLEPDYPVSPRLAYRITFGGRARIILQTTGDAGQVTVHVTSQDLKPASFTLPGTGPG